MDKDSIAKCGEPAEIMQHTIMGPISKSCMLPKGHEGSHRGGGICFIHGDYVGDNCPRWPSCIEKDGRHV